MASRGWRGGARIAVLSEEKPADERVSCAQQHGGGQRCREPRNCAFPRRLYGCRATVKSRMPCKSTEDTLMAHVGPRLRARSCVVACHWIVTHPLSPTHPQAMTYTCPASPTTSVSRLPRVTTRRSLCPATRLAIAMRASLRPPSIQPTPPLRPYKYASLNMSTPRPPRVSPRPPAHGPPSCRTRLLCGRPRHDKHCTCTLGVILHQSKAV